MPRFYFDLNVNGDLSLDQHGEEFATKREAHRQAILALAEIAAEKIPENGTLDIRMLVADDLHRPVAQAHVHFEPDTRRIRE
ncbi:hypothetical protein ABIB57_004852 [Devosia sp. UYZn731]|uniref:DUF6894 family protein n=1 Tax=Devosia sp. UYZn731 TaxID=3156345 RepID=UPI0033925B78